MENFKEFLETAQFGEVVNLSVGESLINLRLILEEEVTSKNKTGSVKELAIYRQRFCDDLCCRFLYPAESEYNNFNISLSKKEKDKLLKKAKKYILNFEKERNKNLQDIWYFNGNIKIPAIDNEVVKQARNQFETKTINDIKYSHIINSIKTENKNNIILKLNNPIITKNEKVTHILISKKEINLSYTQPFDSFYYQWLDKNLNPISNLTIIPFTLTVEIRKYINRNTTIKSWQNEETNIEI